MDVMDSLHSDYVTSYIFVYFLQEIYKTSLEQHVSTNLFDIKFKIVCENNQKLI